MTIPERAWKQILKRHDPALFAEWGKLVEAALGARKVSEKNRHLIWVAIDSVTTHLYGAGTVLHAEHAIAHGATVGEVLDTLRIASCTLPKGLATALPILAEELARAGKPRPAGVSGGDDWQALASRFCPALLQAYERWLEAPGSAPGLDERTRCLVTLSVVGCPAVADPEGIRESIRRALELGVAQDEIIEVLQLASLIGTHSVTHALDQLAPVLAGAQTDSPRAAAG